MPEANEIEGVVLERSSAVLLARVVHADDQPIVPAEIGSIAYTVTQRPGCGGAKQAVSGHENVPLSPESVLYGTLQTGAEWTVDAVGFNFRHELNVSTDAAFPSGGRAYEVRYELTPLAGQAVVVRFLIRAI